MQALAEVGLSLELRRNCALTRVERNLALGAIAVVSVAISAGCAWFGAWPVVPFAGAEVLVLVWVCIRLDRHAGDYERVRVVGDRLIVESRTANTLQSHEFSRSWAQVQLCQAGQEALIRVRSHGREVRFGRYLTDDQKREVAQQLREQLRQRF